MRNSRWLRPLAYTTGAVNQKLLLRNEYLAAEKPLSPREAIGKPQLTNPERATLAEIAKRVGPKAPLEIASVATPSAGIESSSLRSSMDHESAPNPGRPNVSPEIETLIVRMVREPGLGL